MFTQLSIEKFNTQHGHNSSMGRCGYWNKPDSEVKGF